MHAYLPTTIISDMGSDFLTHVIKEVADVLGITLHHTTKKHAQTIERLEQSHASLKQTLNTETGELRPFWLKCVTTAVLNYKTSYHAINGC